MKQKLFICSAAAALVFSAATASALTFNSAQFIGIDRDADNMISIAEAENYRIRYFTTLDINNNGQVEFEEYVQTNKLRNSTANPSDPVRVPDEYKDADTNGDTILSAEEFAEQGRRRFELLDKDKDGMVSRDEFVSPGL